MYSIFFTYFSTQKLSLHDFTDHFANKYNRLKERSRYGRSVMTQKRKRSLNLSEAGHCRLRRKNLLAKLCLLIFEQWTPLMGGSCIMECLFQTACPLGPPSLNINLQSKIVLAIHSLRLPLRFPQTVN